MTAVAERPVTKILAAVAGFFVERRLGPGCDGATLTAFFSKERADGGGGGGRSGSFSISRHPHHRHGDHRHDDRRHDLRPHHGRHRLHGPDELELVSRQGE